VIPGYEGYEVSSLGRVRSFWRPGGPQRRFPSETPRILRPSAPPNGYLYVGIGRHSKKAIHRLVLLAFVGPCPDDCEASHLNGDRRDNRSANLVWEAPLKNHRRREQHGTSLFGERNPNAKLNTRKVLEIRRLLSEGWKGRAIAKKVGTTEFSVSKIKRGHCWSKTVRRQEGR